MRKGSTEQGLTHELSGLACFATSSPLRHPGNNTRTFKASAPRRPTRRCLSLRTPLRRHGLRLSLDPHRQRLQRHAAHGMRTGPPARSAARGGAGHPKSTHNTNRCLHFVFLMRIAQGQPGLSGTLTCFMSVARTHSITCFRSASCSCGWKRCAGKQGDGFSYKDKR